MKVPEAPAEQVRQAASAASPESAGAAIKPNEAAEYAAAAGAAVPKLLMAAVYGFSARVLQTVGSLTLEGNSHRLGLVEMPLKIFCVSSFPGVNSHTVLEYVAKELLRVYYRRSLRTGYPPGEQSD